MDAPPPPPDPAFDAGLHLRPLTDAFADTVTVVDPTAEVAACPGWSALRLVEHLGQIHRWAAFCARHGRAPSRDERDALETFDPSRPDLAASWYRGTADELVEVLDGLDPDAPTWHPFPTAQVGAFWPRRQALETAIHLWDLELAGGRAPTALAPELASDGIDEYLSVVVPRLRARGAALPEGSVHLHCTDVAGEWLAWVDAEAGSYELVRAHQKGDAALRGPASGLLAAVWGRDHPARGDVSIVGDEAVAEAWLTVGGA